MRWLSKLLRRPEPKNGGHVHIYAPAVGAKSLTRHKCPDCKQSTIMVGFFQDWLGWADTCIRCGRRFYDGEWGELEFSRSARQDSIKSALENWDRWPNAERVHRVKTKVQSPECRGLDSQNVHPADPIQSKGW